MPIVVTTNPTGYEDIFVDLFSYSVDDESIATVSADGVITGVSEGNTSVTVKNGEKVETIDVTVTDVQHLIVLLSVIATVLFAFLYLKFFE